MAAEAGNAPASIEADSGVRRIDPISAPNLKTWESSVVVKAGETLADRPDHPRAAGHGR